MVGSQYTVTRVFNNNAVLAYVGNQENEIILLGRGIGFGKKPGSNLDPSTAQQTFVATGKDRVAFLEMLENVETPVLEIISQAINMGIDLLGSLDPSIYLMLTDHLVFTVQRLHHGSLPHSTLLAEIAAVYPEEFKAAQVIVNFLNSNLCINLPPDEAALITLHLQAARTGRNVKRPLAEANQLASLVDTVASQLGVEDVPNNLRADLTGHLAHLQRRVDAGNFRENKIALILRGQLGDEWSMAKILIGRLIQKPLSSQVTGEIAYLAMFLHGWCEDLKAVSQGAKRLYDKRMNNER